MKSDVFNLEKTLESKQLSNDVREIINIVLAGSPKQVVL